MTRFFINIGRKDKLNPARLIGLINEQKIADNVEIGQIEILDTFSFFELDKNYANETVTAFEDNDIDFEGRGVNVEITTKKRSGSRVGRRKDTNDSGNRRKKRNGKTGGDYSGFGRRRSDTKSAFGSEKSPKRRKRAR